MPPKSSADFASQAFTPDCVCSPSLFFSGGAHARESGDEEGAAAVTPTRRDFFMGEPSDGQADQWWRGDDGGESSR